MQRQLEVDPRDLEDTLRIFKRTGGEIEKELLPTGKWLLTVTFPDGSAVSDEAPPQDPTPVAPPSPAGVSPDTAELGILSARFESGNRSSAAIGHDSTGGFSYGKYQIATKTGTMADFLNFCERTAPGIATPLKAAGGAAAAERGDEAFKTAWRDLAKGADLPKAEHGFIEETHYAPFVKRLDAIGLHVARRTFALRNVCWSVAVQHGSGNNVVKNALDPLPDPQSLKDRDIIKAIYKERSNVNKYFSKSKKSVKDAVKNRFKEELADALEMLEAEA